MQGWTVEQQGIFNVFSDTSTNLIIKASPGSGKTTVLRELWERSDDATLYLAFNKSIVKEAEQKLKTKQHSDIMTFHGLGSRLCTRAFTRAFKSKLNTNKCYKYIKELEHTFPHRKEQSYSYMLYTAVQYCKSNLPLRAITEPSIYLDEISDLVEYYNLEVYQGIESDIAIVLHNSNRDTKTIDFADMLLLPVLYDVQFPFYELLLCDEAQDISAIQREMIRKLHERNTHLRSVFVGDSHQAIYGFRGALSNSLELLDDEFLCRSLPLTVSWRCSVAVVEEAQTVFPNDILASPDAKLGTVDCIQDKSDIELNKELKPFQRKYPATIAALENTRELYNESSFILCRTMAPLVSLAQQLLQANIPCQVKGRDLGKAFISYIKKSKCEYVGDFLCYLDRETEKGLVLAKLQNNDAKIQSLCDRKDTLHIFAQNTGSIDCTDLIEYIEELFGQSKGIVLSTIHRAKGLEADVVFILAPDLLPHPLARGQEALEQERNLAYVAITRSRDVLYYI